MSDPKPIPFFEHEVRPAGKFTTDEVNTIAEFLSITPANVLAVEAFVVMKQWKALES